jgi:very-short-patch-repair endonuclease
MPLKCFNCGKSYKNYKGLKIHQASCKAKPSTQKVWGKKGKRKRADGTLSPVESEFLKAWEKVYPHIMPKQEYRFHEERRWRFDFAWPIQKVAVEIQGFEQYHTSYEEVFKDYEKYNAATERSWSIFFFMSKHLKEHKMQTIQTVHKMLRKRDPHKRMLLTRSDR